ncbi:MAG TPA: DUF3761 domain-containing protein [Phenylobacterium sp.]|uniref:DUF3761 domain-containing protein n=1 Tax=Phenylobacterium sp. TaxID=1871053 RepID=UPI002C4F9314|nr:DUF3761 domain-containing protein [Phenylobacterium sp.]HSV02642.1 DUF3761 domain-containing protein [Phenylobacterium sp.]
MLRKSQAIAAAGALALLAAGAADAKTCRDAAGHFAACPKAAAKATPAASAAVNASARPGMAATAQARCRDAQGHFVSCAAVAAPAPRAAARARPSVLSRITRAPTGTAVNTAAAAPAAPAAPGAATARCRDGSLSYSRHRSGSCAGHGGVAAWL